MITISRLWYVTTAVHMWRFYFRYTTAKPEQFSNSSRLNWEACKRAIQKFTDFEIELLRQYYMTSYGNYEDLKTIKEFAEANKVESGMAWDTIKRANYEVIVERGLMERREVKNNE